MASSLPVTAWRRPSVEAIVRRRAGQQFAKQSRPSGCPGRSRTRRADRRPAAHIGPALRIGGPSQPAPHLRAHGPLVEGIGFEHMVEDDQRFLRCALRHRGRQFHQYLAMGFPELIAARRQPIRIRQVRQQIATVQVGRSAQACLVTCSSTRRRPNARTAAHRHRPVQHHPARPLHPGCEQPVAAGPSAGERAASDIQGLMQVPSRRQPAPGRATGGPVPARDGGAGHGASASIATRAFAFRSRQCLPSTAIPSTYTMNEPSSWMRNPLG